MVIREDVSVVTTQLRVNRKMYVGLHDEVFSGLDHFKLAIFGTFDFDQKFKLMVILAVEALQKDVTVAYNLKTLGLITLDAVWRQKLAEPGSFEVNHT